MTGRGEREGKEGGRKERGTRKESGRDGDDDDEKWGNGERKITLENISGVKKDE